ncbi:MAG: Gfo/Idh/MocA family oxidoreductase [Magnetococcales bacterium]|nr:Gfo/Idh/MocA family oxidoreductase [Magnetococcales bacterium]
MANRAGEGLRAAVIGVGYLGRFHAQKYARMEGVKLVAVADSQYERAMRVAGELGVEAVRDYTDLLAKVDLVSVVTPTHTHYSVAAACLSAGVHVLVEKPMTMTLEEADGLIALADKLDRVLQVGHIKRFHPAVNALESRGLLLRPHFIEAHRFAPFKNRALDVDVVLDLMIHDVDLILHFVDSKVTEIEAVGAPVVTGHVDMANARIRFENGCTATVSASRVAKEATRRMWIYQDNELIELDFIRNGVVLTRRGAGVREMDGIQVPVIEETSLPVIPHDSLEAEIHSFCQAVRKISPVRVSGRDGRQALDVVMTIRRRIAESGLGGAS